MIDSRLFLWYTFFIYNIKIYYLCTYIFTLSMIVSELNKVIRKLTGPFVILNPDVAPEEVEWDLLNFT